MCVFFPPFRSLVKKYHQKTQGTEFDYPHKGPNVPPLRRKKPAPEAVDEKDAMKLAENYLNEVGKTASEKLIKSRSQESLKGDGAPEPEIKGKGDAMRVAEDYLNEIGKSASDKLIKSQSQESLERMKQGDEEEDDENREGEEPEGDNEEMEGDEEMEEEGSGEMAESSRGPLE